MQLFLQKHVYIYIYTYIYIYIHVLLEDFMHMSWMLSVLQLEGREQ
jgi:hypothetical protein